ncbi:hypothetical protein E8E13_011098 [Curvularia kusanoi]|uniref:GED domain-containing protein n=1 Tax=Curvularia kusanoi TaxID=90978 RepID=A0A9P4TIS9_CURKU|nr:hypothetical protein E8E13_011098 [Curvularia kusanoi]
MPDQSHNEAERISLSNFRETLDGFHALPDLIDNAKRAMAIGSFGRAFSKNLLRIEVSGPDRPHLTIVDLPGLIHSETKQQSMTDVELSILGIAALRERLSGLLLNQIAAELPGLIEEIELKSSACRTQLQRLGLPQASIKEQRHYLLSLSQTSQSLIKAATDGTYNNDFFGDAKADIGYQKRIRAAVQNLNQSFAETMTREGHHYAISDYSDGDSSLNSSSKVRQYTRAQVLDRIKTLMKRTRGCELPDAATSSALFQTLIEPALENIVEDAKRKTADLLAPHKYGHLITYNYYFTETVQQVKRDRSKVELTRLIKDVFGVKSLSPSAQENYGIRDYRPLLDALMDHNNPDTNHLHGDSADDLSYQVAFKRFVDDIAVEAVETNLVAKLATSSGESDQSRSKRKQLTKQLNVLAQGLETCKKVLVGNLHGTSWTQMSLCYTLKTKTNTLCVTDTRGVAIRSIEFDSPGLSSLSHGTESDEAEEMGSQDEVDAPTDSVYEVASISTTLETEEAMMPAEQAAAVDDIVKSVEDEWDVDTVTKKGK